MTVLTVAEAKKYLRYDAADTSNDDPLAIIVAGAQRWVENYTDHILEQRTVTQTFPAFPTAAPLYFDLRYKPYVADSLVVSYLDADFATVSDFDAFTIYAHEGTQRVIPDSAWPDAYQGVSLSYTAGYADIDAVPEDIIHAICIYAAATDQERASPDGDAWKALDSILWNYRLPVLA